MAVLKSKEMAERLNVTVKTLQIQDKKGTPKAYRTSANRRYYTEQYLKHIGQSDKNNRKIVVYDKVSTDMIWQALFTYFLIACTVCENIKAKVQATSL